MSKPLELSGMTFGRLVAIKPTSKRVNKQIIWECRCSCGKTHYVAAVNLRNGNTRSCGCLVADNIMARSVTHGCSRVGKRTPEYRVWTGMLTRCRNSSDKRFPQYGGRGIRVCNRWLKFENFLADMGERPSLNHSIDRIDNDGDYEPTNCRWATYKEQAQHTLRTLVVDRDVDGKPILIGNLCQTTGLKYATIYRRYQQGDRGDRLIRPIQSKKE